MDAKERSRRMNELAKARKKLAKLKKTGLPREVQVAYAEIARIEAFFPEVKYWPTS